MSGTAKPTVDALVLGDNLSAVTAALELAEVGLNVELRLTAQKLWPYAPVADPTSEIATLLAKPAKISAAFALPLTQVRAGALSFGADPATTTQLAEPRLAGITANPLAVCNQPLLGTTGAFRAYLDHLLPILAIGKYQNLAELLRRRLGHAAANLAAQELATRYPQPFDKLEITAVFPGLNAAVTRAGSLLGGIALLAADTAEQTLLLPAAGWEFARARLLDTLRSYAVTVCDLGAAELPEARALVLAPASPWEAAELLTNPAVAQLAERFMLRTALARVAELASVKLAVRVATIDWAATPGTELIIPASAPPAISAPATPVRLRQLHSVEAAVLGGTVQIVQLGNNCGSGRIEAAPFATAAAVTAAAAVRESAAGIANTMLVGAAVWGGAEAAAVAATRPIAVRLRRKLMGLA